MGEMSTTYVVRKKGRLTMELGVVMTRQNFGFPSSFFALSLSVCQGKGDEVDTGAGALSEAKTQRRPHSARESKRGGFPLLFRCLCIFLSAGREETPRRRLRRGGGEKGEARTCFKRATA